MLNPCSELGSLVLYQTVWQKNSVFPSSSLLSVLMFSGKVSQNLEETCSVSWSKMLQLVLLFFTSTTRDSTVKTRRYKTEKTVENNILLNYFEISSLYHVLDHCFNLFIVRIITSFECLSLCSWAQCLVTASCCCSDLQTPALLHLDSSLPDSVEPRHTGHCSLQDRDLALEWFLYNY